MINILVKNNDHFWQVDIKNQIIPLKKADRLDKTHLNVEQF